MLRCVTTAFTFMAAGVAIAQESAGAPKPGSPEKPAQTTHIKGADANQSESRGQPRPVNLPQSSIPVPSERTARNINSTSQTNSDHFDMHVADCLILKSQEEVVLLKFGHDRTKSDDVKSAAKMMIAHHEQAIAAVRPFTSKKYADETLSSNGATTSADATTREARKVNADEASSSGTVAHEAIGEKMHRLASRTAQECIALNKEEMEKYKGDEFDQAFLGSQLGAHIGMLAHLKALQGETSPPLNAVVTKMEATTKEHKMHLEKLMVSLNKDAHNSK